MSSLLLAFGSNLGDRALHIRRALQELDGRVGTLVKASSMIETEPEGFESVHSFLNSAALFETELEPLEILRITQEVERMEGRKHKSVNGSYSDRPLDIDMIALDSLLWNSEELTLPHPEVTERSFVLQPLAEIVPNFVHPGTGATYAALFYRIGGRKVRHAESGDVSAETLETVNELLRALDNQVPPITLEDLQKLISREGTVLFFAFDKNDRLCGMAALSLCPLPTGLKAWVEDVVVLPAQRGSGYGKALLEAARREAIRQGATNLNLTSRPSRIAANKMYRNLGYELRETNVYRLDLAR